MELRLEIVDGNQAKLSGLFLGTFWLRVKIEGPRNHFHFTDWEPEGQKLTTGHQRWDKNTDFPPLKQEQHRIIASTSCTCPHIYISTGVSREVMYMYEACTKTWIQQQRWKRTSDPNLSHHLGTHLFSYSTTVSLSSPSNSRDNVLCVTELSKSFTETPLKVVYDQSFSCKQNISYVHSGKQNT